MEAEGERHEEWFRQVSAAWRLVGVGPCWRLAAAAAGVLVALAVCMLVSLSAVAVRAMVRSNVARRTSVL